MELKCSSCPYNKVHKTIPYVATEREKTSIMFIGDIPTAIEARKGICMSGSAVDILKETLRKTGLDPDDKDIYYTTAVKCSYPKRKGKQVPTEVFRQCHDNIKREILYYNPDIIVPLGKNATQTVLNDFKVKVTDLEGRVIEDNTTYGIPILPIKHPAMIIHSPGEYKTFVAHINMLRLWLEKGKLYDPGETKFVLLEDEIQVNQILKKYIDENPQYLSADLETTDLDYRFAEFCVLGLCWIKNLVYVLPRELRHRAKDFFTAKTRTEWIWQHGKYDKKVHWRRELGIIPHHHDTMYLHYILDETSPHDLGYLTKTFLNAKEYKYKMNQQFKAVTLETYRSFLPSLCERVAVDCDLSLQLFHVLYKKVCAEPKFKKLYDTLMIPGAHMLSRTEMNGILTDPDHLEAMKKEYTILLEKIKKEIQDIASPLWDPELYMTEMQSKTAPEKFNPGSPKQMSWMVFKRLRLKPRIKKGDSTSVDILESIEGGHPLIDKVLEYRRVAKEQSTYVIGLLNRRDSDGRVRSNFSLHITATGRLSSKEPNVQNIPSAFGVGNVRRAFIAPKGKILMEVDYSGAELRWLACMSGCPVLTKIFEDGINLHDYTAVSLFGENFTKQDRMRAKAVNFGIPYGREPKSLADEFNSTIEEAEKMLHDWLDTYHGARDFLQGSANAVLEGKYLETLWGRRRRFGLVTPATLHSLQNEARNFPIQSPSSDSLLYACIQLEDELLKVYNTKIINLIHDSMLLEVPADPEIIIAVSKTASDYMKKIPNMLFGLKIPFESDTDIGYTWGDFANLNRDKRTVEVKKKDVDLVEWMKAEEAKMEEEVYSHQWYKELQVLNIPTR